VVFRVVAGSDFILVGPSTGLLVLLLILLVIHSLYLEVRLVLRGVTGLLRGVAALLLTSLHLTEVIIAKGLFHIAHCLHLLLPLYLIANGLDVE